MQQNNLSMLKQLPLLITFLLTYSPTVAGVKLKIRELQPDPRDCLAYPMAFSSTNEKKILGLCKTRKKLVKNAWPCLWDSQGLRYFKPSPGNLMINEIRFSQDETKIFGLARKNTSSTLKLLAWEVNAVKSMKAIPTVILNTQDPREVNSFWISDDGEKYILCFNIPQNNNEKSEKPPYLSNCVQDLKLNQTEIIVQAAVSTNGILYLLIQDASNPQPRLEKIEQNPKDSILINPSSNNKVSLPVEENKETLKQADSFTILHFEAPTYSQYRSKQISLSIPHYFHNFTATNYNAWIHYKPENSNHEPFLLLWDKSTENRPTFLEFPPEIKVHSIESVESCQFGRKLAFSFSNRLKENKEVKHYFYLLENFKWIKIGSKIALSNLMRTRLTKVFGSNQALSFSVYKHSANQQRFAYLINLEIDDDFEKHLPAKEIQKENSIIEFSPWIYKLSKNDERFNPEYFTVLPIDVFNAKDTFESGTWIVSTKAKKEPCRTKFYTIKMIESSEESSGTPHISDSWCTHQ